MKLPCGHNAKPEEIALLLPDSAILARAGQISSRRRQSIGRNGGRPPVPTVCPKCGRECPSARAARAHKCR